jgi:hypothetical protein
MFIVHHYGSRIKSGGQSAAKKDFEENLDAVGVGKKSANRTIG